MTTHCSILAWRIPMDRGAWLGTVHRVTKSQVRGKLMQLFFCFIGVCFAVLTQSVVSDFCDLMDCSLPGSSVLGDSPGKNTGVGCHALLQGIFPPQGSNSGLPHCRRILYHLSHQGGPNSRAPELQLLSPHVLQVLKPVSLKLVVHYKRRDHSEKPKHYNEEQPPTRCN